MIQPLCRTVWSFLKKQNSQIPYDTAVPLLGIYPEKPIIPKESSTTMYFAALFTIARPWKPLKCPSTLELIKKMWSIYTLEYYLAIIGSKIKLFVVSWMELDSVQHTEVTQKEKKKYRIMQHIYLESKTEPPKKWL